MFYGFVITEAGNNMLANMMVSLSPATILASRLLPASVMTNP